MKKFIEKIKEFILKHKKLSIISAAVIVLLAIVIICIICFSGSSEPEETTEDKLRRHVNAQVLAYVMIRYDTTYTTPNITTLRGDSESGWEVYGKVTTRDKFGDNYTGTFEGTCIEDKENDDFSCDLDYSTMYKDR